MQHKTVIRIISIVKNAIKTTKSEGTTREHHVTKYIIHITEFAIVMMFYSSQVGPENQVPRTL